MSVEITKTINLSKLPKFERFSSILNSTYSVFVFSYKYTLRCSNILMGLEDYYLLGDLALLLPNKRFIVYTNVLNLEKLYNIDLMYVV